VGINQNFKGEKMAKVTTDIPTSRVRDLLVSAFEGGSNYWIKVIDWKLAEGLKYEDFKEGGKFALDDYYPAYFLIPFNDGCYLEIEIQDDDDGDFGIKILDSAAMQRGLELMATEPYKSHWQNFINENDDAETADVWLQLSLFGELIFG
jgi:hypothetical protein